MRFLSTPSARRATRAGAQRRRPYSNFYPRPPRGGRHGAPLSGEPFLKISIHALREEGDRPPRCAVCGQRDFYPRPPRGGRQPPALGYIKTLADVFLSTPSARRATFIAVVKTRCFYYFYPRPPRGGRHKILDAVCRVDGISIHALREEGDLPDSTVAITLLEISIHALREEGDIRPASLPCGMMNFYPRPPRGGRRKIKV